MKDLESKNETMAGEDSGKVEKYGKDHSQILCKVESAHKAELLLLYVKSWNHYDHSCKMMCQPHIICIGWLNIWSTNMLVQEDGDGNTLYLD